MAGPVSVIGAEAVPGVWPRNAPEYVPGANRMVWPGLTPARAAVSCAAVLTSTIGPAGGGADGEPDGDGDGDGDEDEDGDGDTGVDGVAPPEHGVPLIVQLTGSPPLAALKPKLTVAPGATAPFHDTFVNR